MIDLKRTIAGVRLFADTDDPTEAEKVRARLDAMHQSHQGRRAGDRFGGVFKTLDQIIKGGS